jgi:hypothetical protein
MQSPTFGTAALLIAVTLAGSPVSAQLYKWVDERGVTNYSDQAPVDAATLNKLRPIDNRVSVYSPDAALTSAVESLRRGDVQGAVSGASRTGAGHEQAPPATVVMQDSCLSGAATGCTSVYAGVPYDPWYGYVRPPLHRPRHVAQPRLMPGATAGNVVGMDGYIPGYSVYAPPARALPNVPAPRALYELPISAGRAPTRR